MSETKKEKVTFGDLKKAKSEFDKELNRVKICININKIGEAKSGIDKCDSHISKMESIIDRMPDRTAADIVKKLVPTVLAILSSTVVSIAYFDKRADELEEEYNKLSREETRNWKKYHKAKDKADDIKDQIDIQKHIQGERAKQISRLQGNLDDRSKTKLSNLNDDYNEISSLIEKLESQYKEIDKEGNTAYNKATFVGGEIDQNNDKLIKNNIGKKVVTGSTLGVGVLTSISLKPLKQKAKVILNKCKKRLERTKKYLAKIENMNKSVKESFDETLDDLYIAFTEGIIDKYEYDVLSSHLLS